MLSGRFAAMEGVVLVSVILFALLIQLVTRRGGGSSKRNVAPLHIFHGAAPLIGTVHLDLLPLTNLSFSTFTTRIGVTPKSLSGTLGRCTTRDKFALSISTDLAHNGRDGNLRNSCSIRDNLRRLLSNDKLRMGPLKGGD